MLLNSALFVVGCLLSSSVAQKKFNSKHLPNYISACRVGSDLSDCIVKHARASIPQLSKGDPAFGSPSLNPWVLEKIELNPSSQLKLLFTDCKIYGLNNAILKDAKIDFDKKHIDLVVYIEQIKLDSHYNMDGQLLVLPIKGDGKTNLEFGDCTFNYSFDYDLITRKDGKQYITNIRPDISFKINKAHFNFENLFNGNKQLGDNINNVLNDNPQDAVTELGPAFSNVINLAATTIIRAYLMVVPFDELFLH
ncbi:protein takeout-like [Sitophilus oryzae]|uniref:Protein takeout-like n=1 Tax=Sitophilus oryzae TaxID=7048 RepID=A0A6J2XML5_SITOR|nr:protein takeout-like [Sitophilus oryzae]